MATFFVFAALSLGIARIPIERAGVAVMRCSSFTSSGHLVIAEEITGSGVFLKTVNGRDVVLTARHVVDSLVSWNETRCETRLACVALDLNSTVHAVGHIHMSSQNDDLAVLTLVDNVLDQVLNRTTWSHATLSSAQLERGDPVYTWGFPSDKVMLERNQLYMDAILSAGHVSAVAPSRIGLDLHVHQGNSGGALFLQGDPGRVVAVVIEKRAPWTFLTALQHDDLVKNMAVVAKTSFMGATLPDGTQINVLELIANITQRWITLHSSACVAIPMGVVATFLTGEFETVKV